MLGEFVQTTGYTRKYAIHLLNSWGRTRLVQIDGQMVKLVVGRPRRAKRRARPRRYDQEVLKALKQIWYVFGPLAYQAGHAAQAPDPDPHLRRLEREGAGILRDRPGGP